MPLFHDELAIVNVQRASLKITNEMLTFLVYSAAWTGIDLDYWLQQGTAELRQKVLQDALVDADSERRRRAAEYVGRLALTDMIPALQKLVEEDAAPTVLREAACSLARMDANGFILYLQGMLRGSPDRQQRALEALDGIQNAVSDAPSLDLLTRPMLRWRLRRFRLRRESRPTKPDRRSCCYWRGVRCDHRRNDRRSLVLARCIPALFADRDHAIPDHRIGNRDWSWIRIWHGQGHG